MHLLNPDPRVLDVLKRLQMVAPGAILAGGYLRDSLLGAQAKDIDFFCHGALDQVSLRYTFPEAKPEVFSQWLQYQDNEVISVWNLGAFDGMPLQLIELEGDPEARAKEHDFGICQVWHDGESPHYTKAFLADVANSEFTLRQCESQLQFDRSMKRFERLSRKYPDHKLVIPEEFQQWATKH